MEHEEVNRILLTRIISPAYEECDVFFPQFQNNDQDQTQWTKRPFGELREWTGLDDQVEKDQEKGAEWEYQLWTRPGVA